MKARQLFAVASIAAATALAVPAGASADETVMLDTFASPSTGIAGPVSTTQPLVAGDLYYLTVDGTWSPANAFNANRQICGTSEPAPAYPSPGTTNGRVTADAEVVFGAAVTTPFSTCAGLGRTWPYHNDRFQMDLDGAGFKHVEPVGGPFTTPAPNHTYTYLVSGSGDNAVFKFQLVDRPTTDNYGQFRIRVHQLTPRESKQQTRAHLAAVAPAQNASDQAWIASAIAHIDNSLNSSYWIDDSHLKSTTGNLVFDQERQAATDLKFVSSPDVAADRDRLAAIDRRLAATLLAEVQAANTGNALQRQLVGVQITAAQASLLLGDTARTGSLPAIAIVNYADAWRVAQIARSLE